jgi:hypothetical protein
MRAGRGGSVPHMPPKLDTAGTLERIFEMYSRQAGVLLPAALIIYLPVALLQIVAGANVLLALVAFVAALIAGTLFQGSVVQAVRDMQDGKRDLSIGEVIASAIPFIAPLIGAGLLAGLGIVIGFVLFIIPGLILLTIWSLIAPVIVVERPGVIAAFPRSQRLVKGNGWRVFGVLIVMFLILIVAQQILLAIGTGIGGDVGGAVGYLVAATITAPLPALTAAILYFTLVAMQEGGGQPVAQADPAYPPVPGASTAPPPGQAPPPPAPPGQAPPPWPPGESPFGR